MGMSIGPKWTLKQISDTTSNLTAPLRISAQSIGYDSPGFDSNAPPVSSMRSNGTLMLTHTAVRGWNVMMAIPRGSQLDVQYDDYWGSFFYTITWPYLPSSYNTYMTGRKVKAPGFSDDAYISNVWTSYDYDNLNYYVYHDVYGYDMTAASGQVYNFTLLDNPNNSENSWQTYIPLLADGFDTYAPPTGNEVNDFRYTLDMYATKFPNTVCAITTWDEPSNNMGNASDAIIEISGLFPGSCVSKLARSARDSYMLIGTPGYPPIYESHRGQYDDPINFSGWLS